MPVPLGIYPQNWLDRYSYDRDPQYDYTIPQTPPGSPGLAAPAMGNPDQFERGIMRLPLWSTRTNSSSPSGDMGPSLPATTTAAPTATPPAKTQEDPAKKQEDPASSVQALLKSMADQQKKRRQLEMFRGISSGLNKAGAALATTAGGIMSGYVPQAQTDEGLQRQQGMLENEVPESLLDTYNKIYFPKSYDENGDLIPGQPTFPQGTTMSQIKSLGGAAASSANRDLLMQRHADRGDWRQRDYDLRKAKDVRIERPDREALDGAVVVIQSMKTILDEYTPDLHGPWEGRVQGILSKLGMPKPAAAMQRSDLAFQLSQFIYLMTGKQMNEQEMGRLEAVMPGPNETREVFKKKLSAFVRNMERRYALRRHSLLRQGKDVSMYPADANDLDPYSEFSDDPESAKKDRYDERGWNYTPTIKDLGPDEPTAGGSSDTAQGEGGAADGDRPTEELKDGEVYAKTKDGAWRVLSRQDAEKFPDYFEEVYDPNQAVTAEVP